MIRSNIEAGIMNVVIDRPEKKNALTSDMYLDLASQIKAAQTDDAVRVILIQGEGEAFCAGNDLADFLAQAQTGQLSSDPESFPPLVLLHSLVDNQVPIVAAVQGPAIGIGFTMLLHFDLVICSEDARLQTPFVDLGLVAEGGSSLLLPERIGRVNAAEVLLLGAPISANRAEQMGLCNKVCSLQELSATAFAIAQALAKKPPNALALSRKLLSSDSTALHNRIDEEAKYFLQCLHSDEAKVALSSFFSR